MSCSCTYATVYKVVCVFTVYLFKPTYTYRIIIIVNVQVPIINWLVMLKRCSLTTLLI